MILMQEVIASAHVSSGRLAVPQIIRRHIPALASLWSAQFFQRRHARTHRKSVTTIQSRTSIHRIVATGIWQLSTLSSPSFCVTLESSMSDLMDEMNQDVLIPGFISSAPRATFVWAQKKKMLQQWVNVWSWLDDWRCQMQLRQDTEWHYVVLSPPKKDMVVLGTETSEEFDEDGDLKLVKDDWEIGVSSRTMWRRLWYCTSTRLSCTCNGLSHDGGPSRSDGTTGGWSGTGGQNYLKSLWTERWSRTSGRERCYPRSWEEVYSLDTYTVIPLTCRERWRKYWIEWLKRSWWISVKMGHETYARRWQRCTMSRIVKTGSFLWRSR